jgi:hypothetical protein
MKGRRVEWWKGRKVEIIKNVRGCFSGRGKNERR